MASTTVRPPYLADLPRFETQRLVVRLATEADVPEIVRYFDENREHLRPFDPARPAGFFEPRFWEAQVRMSASEFRGDRALRLFLFAKDAPHAVVGTANFTRFDRGVSYSCSLGYGLAARAQGHGYMAEALRPAIDFLFHTLRYHRIEANYMPHNRRSGNLLRRLGFVVEGYARDYLLINGRWEDHVLTSLVNPDWSPPAPAG